MVQLRALIQPFEGDVYCHVPIGSSIPVNDFRFAGRGSGNRWNAPGQRTLSLAHDHAPALAEWDRRLPSERRFEHDRELTDAAPNPPSTGTNQCRDQGRLPS